ncbi:uncharacterized protein KY384_003442 [Bacidia gigantensis]|uniref:uncharacterized protein n=1 Tax=Bacidia gigantensis TaxID=2732470 RepID=UPI001D055AF5|nr:uncharacterized protein KY384_003442 [Bacidia gigantensis]KAG8531806.1 hypothetical protein KY384_003442 [Bacidia gigantensis]
MSRAFSTAARALLQFVWKGTQPVASYEEIIANDIAMNSKLQGKVDKVEVQGGEHGRENNLWVSIMIFSGMKRLVSAHANKRGFLEYSKIEYQKAQGPKGDDDVGGAEEAK